MATQLQENTKRRLLAMLEEAKNIPITVQLATQIVLLEEALKDKKGDMSEMHEQHMQKMAGLQYAVDYVKTQIVLLDEQQRTLRATTDDSVKESVSRLEANTERIGKEVAEFEKRLREIVAQSETKNTQNIEKMFNELSTMIAYVESLIHDYDDSEMREHMEGMKGMMSEIEKKIPKEFDATEIVEDIEELEKKVAEFEKRPVGRGGVITDKAVQFALMRSIQAVTPSGTIDGANTDFTVPSTIHAVLSFELNSRVVSLGEYSIVGAGRKTIRFDTAPSSAYSGKSFTITYI